MPSANLELVRSIFAAWEAGDYSSIEWAHPEIEYVFADGPMPGSWRGLARRAEGFQGWLSAWEELRVAADEYRELNDERVLVFSHFTGRVGEADSSSGECGRSQHTSSTSAAAR